MTNETVCKVCGKAIKEEKNCTEHKGEHYCFCSSECKEEFVKDPKKYIKKPT